MSIGIILAFNHIHKILLNLSFTLYVYWEQFRQVMPPLMIASLSFFYGVTFPQLQEASIHLNMQAPFSPSLVLSLHALWLLPPHPYLDTSATLLKASFFPTRSFLPTVISISDHIYSLCLPMATHPPQHPPRLLTKSPPGPKCPHVYAPHLQSKRISSLLLVVFQVFTPLPRRVSLRQWGIRFVTRSRLRLLTLAPSSQPGPRVCNTLNISILFTNYRTN